MAATVASGMVPHYPYHHHLEPGVALGWRLVVRLGAWRVVREHLVFIFDLDLTIRIGLG